MKHLIEKTASKLCAGIFVAGTLTAAALGDPSPAVDGHAFVLIDGDTIALGHERIRLEGPDAPESGNRAVMPNWRSGCRPRKSCAPCSAITRSSSIGMGVDKYNRTLARLYFRDGREVGEELIASGLALRWQPGRAAWLQRARHWCPDLTEE